jgi:serine/threonine protein kinase
MELMTGGTLYDRLHGEKKKEHPLSYLQKLQIARSIARGIQFLHSKNTMHRDLKSKNILVSLSHSFSHFDHSLVAAWWNS